MASHVGGSSTKTVVFGMRQQFGGEISEMQGSVLKRALAEAGVGVSPGLKVDAIRTLAVKNAAKIVRPLGLVN